MKYRLQFPDTSYEPIEFEEPSLEGYVVGRYDEATDYMPDINLLNFGAHEAGVSRRHIALVRYRGAMHVIDLNSVNGTFINEQRVMPDDPKPLKEGDLLRLGTLKIYVVSSTKPAN